MNKNELKTLEEKTKGIVDTLDNLETEIQEYQKKNVDIVSAIKNLANISKQVAKASKELSSAAALFSSSDFSKALKEIDERIDKVKAANQSIDEFLEIKNTVTEVKQIVDILATKIGRIDRNTQIGFWKERG